MRQHVASVGQRLGILVDLSALNGFVGCELFERQPGKDADDAYMTNAERYSGGPGHVPNVGLALHLMFCSAMFYESTSTTPKCELKHKHGLCNKPVEPTLEGVMVPFHSLSFY